MRTGKLILGVILIAVAFAAVSFAEGKKIRVGVYDNRAVAVAYGRSAFFEQEINAVKVEYNNAKTEGKNARMKELDGKMEKLQKKAHKQAFAAAPVDDILAKIKDQLPKVAADANVAVITSKVNFVNSDEIEVVDITFEIIKPFKPDEKTVSIIKSLVTKPALTEEEAESCN
jgi:hypothetical protein